jgi:hypothetical protein
MDNVIDINAYKHQTLKKRIYGPWQRRFGETFHLKTRLGDLSDRTLFLLAQPGDNNAEPFYELIMGVLGLGDATHFFYLDDHHKLTVVDIHMFLADHVRFEMMQRLLWIENHSCLKYPIVSLVQQFDKLKPLCMAHPPTLVRSHPGYQTYISLIPIEKQIFIRRMLREALAAFQRQEFTTP